jgi:hypothetical protein
MTKNTRHESKKTTLTRKNRKEYGKRKDIKKQQQKK